MIPDRSPKYAACVSWPRSGHHLLVRLLRRTAGPNFKYCTFYGQEGRCCGQFPCNDTSVNLSKNHDFGLDLPVPDGVWYIVQWRSFLPSLVSNFELMLADHPESDTADGFWAFGVVQSERYSRFREKWVDSDIPARTLVKYEDLVAAPKPMVEGILRTYGVEYPRGRLDRAVAEVARERIEAGKKVLDPSELGVRESRDIAAFRFYDPARFEKLAGYAAGTLAR